MPRAGADQVELDAAELAMLLAGIDLASARRKRYQRSASTERHAARKKT